MKTDSKYIKLGMCQLRFCYRDDFHNLVAWKVVIHRNAHSEKSLFNDLLFEEKQARPKDHCPTTSVNELMNVFDISE